MERTYIGGDGPPYLGATLCESDAPRVNGACIPLATGDASAAIALVDAVVEGPGARWDLVRESLSPVAGHHLGVAVARLAGGTFCGEAGASFRAVPEDAYVYALVVSLDTGVPGCDAGTVGTARFAVS